MVQAAQPTVNQQTVAPRFQDVPQVVTKPAPPPPFWIPEPTATQQTAHPRFQAVPLATEPAPPPVVHAQPTVHVSKI